MLIALDVDGVLLDYNAQFARLAAEVLDRPLRLVDPDAHHFVNAYGITLSREDKQRIYDRFDRDGWLTMPPMERAVDAAQRLHADGHRLFCVSSMPPRFAAHRAQNLENLGIVIDGVIGSDRDESREGHNPKAEHLIALAPDVFVDDQLRNFLDLPAGICKVWIDRGTHDSPNNGMDPSLADHRFPSLHAFMEALVANPSLFQAAARSDDARSDRGADPRPESGLNATTARPRRRGP